MHYLALDIGARRTGVAYCDDAIGIPLPLPTLTHDSAEDFARQATGIIRERTVENVLVGLPRLPSGEEGAQAAIVRSFASLLRKEEIPVTFIDERYTTPSPRKASQKHQNPDRTADPDSAAACEILRIAGIC